MVCLAQDQVGFGFASYQAVQNRALDELSQYSNLKEAVADPGFGKGGFMRMCTVATTPPFDAHAHRCNESGCCL